MVINKIARALGGGLAILLLAALILPLVVPIPALEGTVQAETLADEDSRFMTVKGLQVHYKIWGEGKPVFILLHGFGASLFSWREVVAPLSEFGTVIAYDRPAFGLTERPLAWNGENPYSQEAQVQLVLGIMDALQVEKATLIGNSAGGTIAMLAALENPNRVERLILVDPAVYAGGGAPAWIRPLFNTPQMKRLGPLLARNFRTQGRELIRTAWHAPENITAEIFGGYEKPLQVENWDKALWELTAASKESQLVQRLGEFNLPVLVITGDDDRIVPTEQSVRLAKEIPGAKLAILQACGHVPHEECPTEFMQAVKDILQGLNQEIP